MPFSLVRNDITKMDVDAIVNAANTELRAGGGVCGAIFRAAGIRDLQAACDKIGHVDTGAAVATPGFALPARWVIHTAGPVYNGGRDGERELLASCYTRSLELAAELGAASVAFPLISAGIYGYPRDKALEVAVEAIGAYLERDADMEVYLVLFDASTVTVARNLYDDVAAYIDDVYAAEQYLHYPENRRREREFGYDGGLSSISCEAAADMATINASAPADLAAMPADAAMPAAAPASAPKLDELLKKMDAPFSSTLLAMIDERGLKDADVYRRANLSRQYFSKLRAGSLKPGKRAVLALAVALELPLDDCRLLLERAGYALTHTSKLDIIVEYFIMRGDYDIQTINATLFSFDQQLLGAG